MGTKKKLDPELKEILKGFGGDEAITIGEEIFNLEYEVTDEELHGKTGVKLNQVRKILYILNEINLTLFKRVKDKKTGWYVYYWLHNFDNYREIFAERQKEVLNLLKLRYRYEKENIFFVCSGEQKCPRRYTYEQAMELDFRCPRCREGYLSEKSNDDIKHVLRNQMIHLRDNVT